MKGFLGNTQQPTCHANKKYLKFEQLKYITIQREFFLYHTIADSNWRILHVKFKEIPLPAYSGIFVLFKEGFLRSRKLVREVDMM